VDPKFGRVEQRRSKAKLDHLGYAVDEDLKESKNKRNQALLEKMVREEPQNAYAHYTLAQQYSLNNKNIEAVNHFKVALKINKLDKEMVASLHNQMAESLIKLNQNIPARESAMQSIKLVKEQVGAYYILYRIAEKENQTDSAIAAVDKMMVNCDVLRHKGWQIANDVMFDPEKLNYTLGILYLRKNDFLMALKAFKSVLKVEPQNEDVLNKAIQAALTLANWPEAEKMLQKLIQINPERKDTYDTLGVVYIKQGNLKAAVQVYEKLHRLVPQSKDITKRLAGLYLKLGDERKAMQLIS
jgi:tetratricopeptide (TPR) repeat protein